LPCEAPIKTISELAIHNDKQMREHVFKIQGRRSDLPDAGDQKSHVPCLVGFSDQYATLSESAIQGFLSFIAQYDVEALYLQNPPTQLAVQLERLGSSMEVLRYLYRSIDYDALRKINATYSDVIIGQENVLRHLLVSLYQLCKTGYDKPVVFLFYGPTGVGKSETVLFLSRIMEQKIFRRQLSMFNANEFASYLFGGRHSQSCFAKDLMERESNVILLDEFDKANPIFHSAFYQFFDDGVYEDRNYHAEIQKAVIVCTSNYRSQQEAKETLGASLFARFDAVIGFEPLSRDAITKIIDKEYKAYLETLEAEELRIIQLEEIHSQLQESVDTVDNCRQIKQIVRNTISEALLESVLVE
jgi:ATP-dependent Clp protease ATP-binding subunit ClpA